MDSPPASMKTFLAWVVLFASAISSLHSMEITSEPWGKTQDEQPVSLFTLKNEKGMTVRITNYGGIIVSLLVPDKDGKLDDVTLGYDTLAEYESNNPYFGCITGRYANRIANGTFSLEGTKYTLAANDKPNHLHGGIKGFDKKVWNATPEKTEHAARLVLKYTSPDGEEGYPGNLDCTVTYELTQDNRLVIRYLASTDKVTVINLTNHSYFNLAGHGDGNALDQILTLYASTYTPTDKTQIPTGQIASVKNTPLDFTSPDEIGRRINDSSQDLEFGLGYDHNFILDDQSDGLKKAATLFDPTSGRRMDVFTTKPAIQFYSGNHLKHAGKGGAAYPKRSGVCLETQFYPDSPNRPDFPSSVLKPGMPYQHTTEYHFSAATP